MVRQSPQALWPSAVRTLRLLRSKAPSRFLSIERNSGADSKSKLMSFALHPKRHRPQRNAAPRPVGGSDQGGCCCRARWFAWHVRGPVGPSRAEHTRERPKGRSRANLWCGRADPSASPAAGFLPLAVVHPRQHSHRPKPSGQRYRSFDAPARQWARGAVKPRGPGSCQTCSLTSTPGLRRSSGTCGMFRSAP